MRRARKPKPDLTEEQIANNFAMAARLRSGAICDHVRDDGVKCRAFAAYKTPYCIQHGAVEFERMRAEKAWDVAANGPMKPYSYDGRLPPGLREAYIIAQNIGHFTSLKEEITLSRALILEYVREAGPRLLKDPKKHEDLVRHMDRLSSLVTQHMTAAKLTEELISKRDAALLAKRICEEWITVCRKWLPQEEVAAAVMEMRQKLVAAVVEVPVARPTGIAAPSNGQSPFTGDVSMDGLIEGEGVPE